MRTVPALVRLPALCEAGRTRHPTPGAPWPRRKDTIMLQLLTDLFTGGVLDALSVVIDIVTWED